MVILLWLCSYQDWNLVENGSFDEFDQCFKHYGQIQAAVGWEQYDGSSADYFNSNCSHGETVAGVPENYIGFQEPHSGPGYAGLYLYMVNERYSEKIRDNYYSREHMQIALKRPMKSGQAYKIEAYISLAEASYYYTDKLSFCFSKKSDLRISEAYSMLSCTNRVIICAESPWIDTDKWQKIEGTYVAEGGETFLTISLFEEDLSFRDYKKALKNNMAPDPQLHRIVGKDCYYYIDDVSVVPMSGKGQDFTHH